MTEPVSEVKRALVVALDNLGDVVFASALVRPLRERFPAARVDIWCKTYTAAVARLIPGADDVIDADPFWAGRPHRPRPPIRPFLRAIADVRRRRYDVALLSEAPWRTAAAVALARVPMRVGLARHRNARFLTNRLPAQDPHQPVVREQARLLGALGMTPVAPHYRLDASRLGTLRDEIARELPSTFVALHPFAGARDRCVPLGVWTQLAFALHARGIPAVWIGTPEELNELRRSYTVPPGTYIDQLRGDSHLRLAVTAAALSLARITVGHDSGPLHVAAAFGVPVLGVFAPGQPDRTFPQGPGVWRMIHRPSPTDVSAGDMLGEIDALEALRTTHPARG